MGYYMGDFSYPGNFRRGDPGFFSFLGRAAKAIGGAAAGIMPGGGPVFGAISRVVGGGAKGKIAEGAGAIIKRGVGAIQRHPVISGAGAAGVIGAGGAILGHHMGAGAPMRGFHVNKHGKVVKNRRMRVTNPRALRRAIRRASGFARLARRVLHFTSPRAPRGRAIFKHKRRKRV